jgi:excinuclease UvrABC nuclease subunit
MKTNEPANLYRCFGFDGELLYVGVTHSLKSRMFHHLSQAAWFGAVADITAETFRDRQAALVAERAAIRDERPQFNTVSKETARTAIIKLTVNKQYRAILAKAAHQASLPLATYVRAAALEKAQARDE